MVIKVPEPVLFALHNVKYVTPLFSKKKLRLHLRSLRCKVIYGSLFEDEIVYGMDVVAELI
jgi:hypothetical protein